MRLRRDPSVVPVLMFHSVGMGNVPWIWSDLSENPGVFEKILLGLADKGFRAVGLTDLFQHMSGIRPLPDNCIVLTFDDGYLDNWVNAVPLLRKYGMHGTVYVTPEFVQDSGEVRPTMEELHDGTGDQPECATAGFMNWGELRAADSEGILDVQCHALTHTWYFSGPKVIDVHRPRPVNPYPWLLWNARPERKPYYLTEDQQHFVRWGQPILEHEKALAAREFIPDPSVSEKIIEYVGSNGGDRFFLRDNWQENLNRRFPVLRDPSGCPGVYESEEDYRKRVLHELTTSRNILESKLGKTIEYLSWPGGGVNETAVHLARKAGFRSWTLSSWQKPDHRNRPGSDAREIKRVSGHGRIYWKNRLVKEVEPSWVVHRALAHQGSSISKIIGSCKKLMWIAASIARNRRKGAVSEDAQG